MNQPTSRPPLDDAQLDALLRVARGSRAPANLFDQVMAATAEAPAPAWWHQPLPAWPRAAQALGLVATGGIAAGLAYGADRAVRLLELPTVAGVETPASVNGLMTLGQALATAGGAVLHLAVDTLASPLVLAGLAGLGACALIVAGCGVATFRLALPQRA